MTAVSLDVWSSQLPIAIIQATAVISRTATTHSRRLARWDNATQIGCGPGRNMVTTSKRQAGTTGTVDRAEEVLVRTPLSS